MCLIVFGWNVHPKYKLVLAANRDEFYNRPTAPAGFWRDQPEILGGRDLKAGGSWMTVSKKGKIAAVTNYRDVTNQKATATSRGEIPVNFLKSGKSPEEYIKSLHADREKYNGFNALIGDFDTLVHYSNYEGKTNIIEPGIHGLSNALLNTNWPKVELAKKRLKLIMKNQFSHDDLLVMMADTQIAEDAMLPQTGVPYEWEKALSAMHIKTENYGTCSTTVITMDHHGKIAFTEKTYPFGPTGNPADNLVRIGFNIG